MNAILVSLGKIHTSLLGCYGGAWLETPAIDQFAADSFAFDEYYVECPLPQTTRRNWWTGCLQHAAMPADAGAESAVKLEQVRSSRLIAALRTAGVRTALIRNSGDELDAAVDAAGFDEIVDVPVNVPGVAESVFEAAIDWLANRTGAGRFVLVVDIRGWDELGESDGSDGSDGSDEAGEAGGDPFFGRVAALDLAFGAFVEQLRSGKFWDESLVALTSDLGSGPLGAPPGFEPKFILSERNTHLPLLVRVPGIEPGRTASLCQTIDLFPTVCDALGLPPLEGVDGESLLPIIRGERRSVRPYLRLQMPGGARALRTSDWLVVDKGAGRTAEDSADFWLFSKPSDRWDRNDVSREYPDELAQLIALLNAQSR